MSREVWRMVRWKWCETIHVWFEEAVMAVCSTWSQVFGANLDLRRNCSPYL
jgi:hypothetical protein